MNGEPQLRPRAREPCPVDGLHSFANRSRALAANAVRVPTHEHPAATGSRDRVTQVGTARTFEAEQLQVDDCLHSHPDRPEAERGQHPAARAACLVHRRDLVHLAPARHEGSEGLPRSLWPAHRVPERNSHAPGLAVRDHTRLAWQEELPHVRSQLEGQEGALAIAPPNSPGASDHMLVRRPL